MQDKEAKAIEHLAGSGSNNARLTINIPEFCELTGISKNLGYALAKQDRLGVKVIHLGKRMVLSRRAVLALLQKED